MRDYVSVDGIIYRVKPASVIYKAFTESGRQEFAIEELSQKAKLAIDEASKPQGELIDFLCDIKVEFDGGQIVLLDNQRFAAESYGILITQVKGWYLDVVKAKAVTIRGFRSVISD